MAEPLAIALLDVPEHHGRRSVLIVLRPGRAAVRTWHPSMHPQAVAYWVAEHMLGLGLECIGIPNTEPGLEVAYQLRRFGFRVNELGSAHAEQQ